MLTLPPLKRADSCSNNSATSTLSEQEAACSLLEMSETPPSPILPSKRKVTSSPLPKQSSRLKTELISKIPGVCAEPSTDDQEVYMVLSDIVRYVQLLESLDLNMKQPIASTMPMTTSQSFNKATTRWVVPSKEKTGNWQCWSHVEEVFLVGTVMERFFSRGSLSSTKRENISQKHNCWETIKQNYDTAWDMYSALTNSNQPPKRTENALSRHYKVMKERSISKCTRNVVDFKGFYTEWERDYNLKYNLFPLTCIESGNLTADGQVDLGAYNSNPGNKGSRGRWNYGDEVILIGVVIETFFQRGSLSSSHRERKKNENDFWKNLHSMFLLVKAEHHKSLASSNNPIDALGNNQSQLDVQQEIARSRTVQALGRHFKVMKVKLLESNGKMNLKTFYRDWQKIYRHHYLNIIGAVDQEPAYSKKASQVLLQSQIPTNAQQPMSYNTSQQLGHKVGFPLTGLPQSRTPHTSHLESSPEQQQLSNAAALLASMSKFKYSPPGPGGLHGVGMYDFNPMADGNSFRTVNSLPNPSTSLGTPTGMPNPQRQPHQMASPRPMVTTTDGATTYWLPVTLYSNGNVPQGNPQSLPGDLSMRTPKVENNSEPEQKLAKSEAIMHETRVDVCDTNTSKPAASVAV